MRERCPGADESSADSARRDLGVPGGASCVDNPEGNDLRVALPKDYVTIIMVMPDLTLPLADIKKRLSEIVDGVEQKHDRVVLTRNGRPAAVILSPDDLESLEETLAILSNPSARHDIREAESEIDQGGVVTADELRAKYLAK
jgi:prevent-host-death family protein